METYQLYLGGATGGTFTLGNGIDNTSAIAYNAIASTIVTELEVIYGSSNVTVNVDSDFTIEINISTVTNLEANFTNLTGDTDPELTLLSSEGILRQFGYRFYQDDAVEGSATPLANDSTDISLIRGSKVRIRIGITK